MKNTFYTIFVHTITVARMQLQSYEIYYRYTRYATSLLYPILNKTVVNPINNLSLFTFTEKKRFYGG